MSNPFGLVYKGAITENKEGAINITPVSYPNILGLNLAGNLYTPQHFNTNKTYPAVVVSHPNGGVKEQVAGLFAQSLAEKGFIALAFDASYQGASGGFPRQTDRPSNRVDDIRSSIDFLQTLTYVDNTRLGALGICGGGGYTIEVAKTDKRIKAIATISMFNTGRVRRNGFGDSQLDSIQNRLNQAAEARQLYAQSGKIDYIGKLMTHQIHYTTEELLQFPAGLYRDGFEYYGDTHYHPNSQSRYTTMSLQDLMAWDAEYNANLINQPVLMMVGDVSDTRYMTDDIFAKLTGTNDKQLIYINGANHIETYWKEPFISQETTTVNQFFSEKL